MDTTVTIDGSYGEGGGQIIRTSLSLAILTGRAVEIANVRAGRAKPGLQPQHLTAVRAAAALCDGHLEGDAVGSTRLLFEPRTPPLPNHYRFDIGTAGATTLVAQTALAPLLHASGESRVLITGGTHVPHSPHAEYLEAVYAPALHRLGVTVSISYGRAGFYPRGGGDLELAIPAPQYIGPVDMVERGRLTSLRAYVVTASLPGHVMERGVNTVEQFMKGMGRNVEIERREKETAGAGAAVVLVAACEGGLAGFTGIGERGKPMEKVAREPCEDFFAWWKSGAACDEHLADQVVLPAALARGESRWSTPAVTEHIRTALWVAQQFIPLHTSIEERPEGGAVVHLARE